MKKYVRISSTLLAVTFATICLSSFFTIPASVQSQFAFPFKKAGLTQRQAAAHLLNRFTYGATPNQIDEVLKMGIEKWFNHQLNADVPDDSLNQRIENYNAIKLSNTEILNTYPQGNQVRSMALKEGVPLIKDSLGNFQQNRELLKAYALQKGFRPQDELFKQFINQKILRATFSNNQLQEVLTEFWFNHFNVSFNKNGCAEFIPNYERDVIRPNALGKFNTILVATAKSPAMLMYLDNFSSAGTNTVLNKPAQQAAQQKRIDIMEQQIAADTNEVQKNQMLKKLIQNTKGKGLNENYAREIMELHTLGVDGGYTQQDVTQAAGILTGWTLYPMSEYGYGGGAIKKMIEKVGEEKMQLQGFVHDGDFLFAANRHDNSDKTVLGKTFKGNDGYQEGLDLLNLLAHHPSTAKFICKKLAIRFVCDNPPQTLLDKMVVTFTKKDGDIKQVLLTMVAAPEFWSTAAIREKIKSPFELAISSLRSLQADVKDPYQIFNWSSKMGERIYHYLAPTGFPDKGQYWINTGSLLNRMNYGLALATQRIQGISFDLAALNNHHEPESAEAALAIYSKLLMPERDVTATVKRLTPLLNDPNLGQKIGDAAGKANPVSTTNTMMESNDMMMDAAENTKPVKVKQNIKLKKAAEQNMYPQKPEKGNNTMLSQVVGVIIGSPEYQRK